MTDKHGEMPARIWAWKEDHGDVWTGEWSPCQDDDHVPPEAVEMVQACAARPLDEWNEDMGHVVWWCLHDGQWLGEPAWIGSPLSEDWPGYHTHFTPHPAFPNRP